MCGLVGAMGLVNLTNKKAVMQLLTIDVIRGSDSTGLALVNNLLDVSVIKKAMNPIDFLDLKSVDEELTWMSNCIIGHNRNATRGAVSNNSAHPFDFTNLVGAHNGTLKNCNELDDNRDFDVDSENLYHHMNNNGVEDTFNKMDGAFALTWFDKTDNCLYFLRNNQRPLCYCITKDNKTMFWASEAWMLYGILSRNKIEHEPIIITGIDTLYKFEVPEGLHTVIPVLKPPVIRKLVKPTIMTKYIPNFKLNVPASNLHNIIKGSGTPETKRAMLLPYIGKVVDFFVDGIEVDKSGGKYISCSIENCLDVEVRVYTSVGSKLWNEMLSSGYNFQASIKELKSLSCEQYLLADLRTVKEIKIDDDDLSDIDIDGNVDDDITVDGYNGEKLTYTQFTKATAQGCSWCLGDSEFGKPINFISKHEFICTICMDVDEVKEYLLDGSQTVLGGMH